MLTRRYVQYWHTRFNNLLFGGKLRRLPITLRDLTYCQAEALYWPDPDHHIELCLTLSDNRAIRAALLHEMVHQWQDENRLPIDHGPAFEQWRTECFARTGLTI